MQCYVKSAGRGYDQDYTWIQSFGEERDCTHLLRQKVRELSERVPSMSIFFQDGEYYLLIGGLDAGRTDIVGTPINNTFAFVCPAEEEQNIRFLTAGMLSSNIEFKQLLFSAIQEDTHNKSGFFVSDNFDNTIAAWLKENGAEVLGSLKNDAKIFKSELASFLQNNLPLFEQNILLVNPDKENCSKFCMFSAYKIDWKSISHDEFLPEFIKYDAEQQSQNDEETMNIQNTTNIPLKELDETGRFKIYLCTAPTDKNDYHFLNKNEPGWCESLRKKLFEFEPMDKPVSGLGLELEENCYHVYLQDGMSKIRDFTRVRGLKVKLLFEFPAQIEGRSKTEVECGLRSICASWTDPDPDYGNKLLREIIERKALVIGEASFEVNEAEMKKILWDFFNKGNSLENKPNQHEVCHIAKDWSGLAEAKRWFGEKLRTTCFSYDNSLLCYFTPCEVRDPEKVSYCARWSRESETIIPKSEDNSVQDTPAENTVSTGPTPPMRSEAGTG